MRLSGRTVIGAGLSALVLNVPVVIGQSSVPQVLYSNLADHPSSLVPGGSGLRFLSFDRPLRSQRGDRWMLLARAAGADTATDAMYLTGSGTQATLRIREGITEIEPGRTAENMSERRCAIDANGAFAVTVNLTGATTDDSVLVRGTDAGVLSVFLREGQSVLAIPGAAFGSTIADVNITGMGLAFRTGSLAGLPSTSNAAILLAHSSVVGARTGTPELQPSGQIGTDAWTAFDVGSLWANSTGSSWIVRGSVGSVATRNAVLAVNNDVRIQESAALPGQGGAVSTILASNMSGDGTWFARGENADDSAWVVRNGSVVFDSNDPVPGGDPSEAFSGLQWNVTNGNSFFEHTGNSRGDWIVGGFTDNPVTARSAVWVLNGSRVVLRRGDGVDLDGDGAAEPGLAISFVGLNGASLNNKVTGGFLTDDGWFYFIADLTLDTAASGEALLRTRVFCPSDFNRDGGTTVQDIFDFLAAYFANQPRADVNGDGTVSVQDIFDFLATYFAGCA